MNTVVAVPPTARERGKIAPAKFAHIVLRTSRFEEMMTFGCFLRNTMASQLDFLIGQRAPCMPFTLP